jgi:ubiquinone/menaquinone biosynthesis C-methylase UbiE
MMLPREFTPDLKDATPKQRAKILLAERLKIGPFFTRTAIWAEIIDTELFGHVQQDQPSPMEMAKLLDDLFNTPSMEARYELLTQPIPVSGNVQGHTNERNWFDYIEDLTASDIIRSISRAAQHLLPDGKTHWEKVADLGAGTGALAAALSGVGGLPRLANSITLVDKSPAMLKVAENKYHDRMKYKVDDVTKLPFPDQSLDLVASSGLIYSLGREHQDDYFREVSRVLSPDGIYLDGDYLDQPPPELDNKVAARFLLASLIKGIVSGPEVAGNPLRGIDQPTYFNQFGLELSNNEHTDDFTKRKIDIRVLRKAT